MKKLLLIIGLSLGTLALTGCNKGPSEPYTIENPTNNFQEYSPVVLASAQEAGDTTVIYFGASRCPGCMALKDDIIAKSDTIPEGVTVLAADFDLAVDLKEKYGVSKKHTTVYIKPNGTVATKNTNKEHSLEDILAGVQSLDSI